LKYAFSSLEIKEEIPYSRKQNRQKGIREIYYASFVVTPNLSGPNTPIKIISFMNHTA